MLTHMHSQNKTLELTVLSTENLHVNRKLNTKDLYVVVRAESINSYTTHTVEERGGDGKSNNPSWNEKLLVDIPMHARCITLKVKCKTSKGVKEVVVGVARIGISELFGGVVHDHCLQFLSYRLRDWEGMRNGVVNFSVKVVESSENVPVMGEKVGERSGSSSGVVGIPVMWNNCISSSSSNIWNLKNENKGQPWR